VLTAIFLPIRSRASVTSDPSRVTIAELILSLEPYVDTTALIGTPDATTWAIAPKNAEALMSVWLLATAWTLSGPPVTSPTFSRSMSVEVAEGVGELEHVDLAGVGLVADGVRLAGLGTAARGQGGEGDEGCDESRDGALHW
jgi:hypothetical protein